MIAYEFYWLDPQGGYQIIGVLPERRKDSNRITQKSVMSWAEIFFGDNLDAKDIYFIQVTINEYTGMILRPTPALVQQK
jgi:hypothetical protein